MELMEAIYTRRSTRKYTEQPVDKKMVEQLLEAAVQAPSATNSQPWSFAVIQDKKLMEDYSDRAKKYLLNNMDEHPTLIKYRAALSKPEFNIFYSAPTLIIIYARPIGPHPIEDCCLAAQNLMLAAHGAGLASCWIGFAHPLLNLPEIKAELGVPTENTAVAPIIIGYPQAKMPPITKKAPEILFWK